MSKIYHIKQAHILPISNKNNQTSINPLVSIFQVHINQNRAIMILKQIKNNSKLSSRLNSIVLQYRYILINFIPDKINQDFILFENFKVKGQAIVSLFIFNFKFSGPATLKPYFENSQKIEKIKENKSCGCVIKNSCIYFKNLKFDFFGILCIVS